MKSFRILFFKFLNIRNQGWIRTMRNGSTGIGYTFEKLLGKNEDSLSLPDYYGIEIKTMRLSSKQKIHLFCANPDGDYKHPIERIISKIGYPDKKNPKYKIFNFTFWGDKFSRIGYYKMGRLVIDKKKKKINLIIKNINGSTIPVNVSWSFNLLKEKLNNKMKKLAVIKAYNTIENGTEYFYYKGIDFYTIKDFDTFINLIEIGIISISFQLNIYRSGARKGLTYNHGTSFSIDFNNIEMLYDKINIFKN